MNERFKIYGQNGEVLVIFKADGRMIFGPNYKPDAAARIFWDTVARLAPGKCAPA